VPADHGALQPQMLPSGREILFTLRNLRNAEPDQIVVQRLDGGSRRVVLQPGSDAQYVPTGHLVYVAAGSIEAVPFNVATLTVGRGPVPLVEGVGRGTSQSASHFGISQTGSLVFVPAQSTDHRTLVWVDRQGREEPLSAAPRAYSHPRISPDGTRIAVAILQPEQGQGVWIWDIAKASLVRLNSVVRSGSPGSGRGSGFHPIWSPDGRDVVFESNGIQRQAADGSGVVERILDRLTSGGVLTFPDALTPNGQTLVAEGRDANRRWQLDIVAMGGNHLSTALMGKASTERSARGDVSGRDILGERSADLSPDGRWIAYQSDESGIDEIYVRPFPNVNDGRWQISAGDGGRFPVWARNGRELFYLAPGGRMMSVAVQSSSTFSVGRSARLFEGAYEMPTEARHFDVAADGRFLMIKKTADQDSGRLIVIENWFEELTARVPTK